MRRIVFLLPGCVAFLQSHAQTDFCSSRNSAFGVGEQLYLKVWYNTGFIWIGAGELRLNITADRMNEREAYHVTMEGKSLPGYEWVYKVRDRYETFIDKETLQPLRFLRHVSEGGYKIVNDVTFKHGAGQAASAKEDGSSKSFTVPRCVQDVLSAIYTARNIDYGKYAPGATIKFPLFLDDVVYNMSLRYVGKEKVKTRYGTFNAIKLMPVVVKGNIFKGDEKLTVWVSDDANHIPLRIESPIFIGNIKVDLMGFDKLRNPLTSLLKKK